MKKFENNVRIAGILIKHTLEETTYGENNIECIRGNVIIRTADESEHTVQFFTNKYKKDSNGNFTSEVSKIYTALMTVINEYKTLEEYPDDADYVEITSAHFGVNDYVSARTNEIVTFNPISSNFINRISKSDYEAASKSAKFEIEGVIASIKDEIVKDEPTGNLNVTMNVITQTQNGRGKDITYEIKDMFPLRLWVNKDIADGFRGVYAEGVFAKISGVLTNKTETKTVIEKQTFGKDLEKTFTNTVRRNEIESGSEPVDIYSLDITDDICSALNSRRNAKLAEIKNKKGSHNSNSKSYSTTPSTNSNPFASKNPFAK